MKIIITGDFVTEGRGRGAVLRKDALTDPIKSLMISADLAIVNLEAPIADDSCKAIEKVGPHLKTGKETVSFLEFCGINIVTLANNHFFDYGKEGVNQTISALEDSTIDFIGGGRTYQELRKILYKEIGNEKIALLNYCEKEFSVQKGIGSNHLNPISIYYDIQEAKRNADIVIVITHGGHEGYQLPSPRMQELYRYIIDLGADVVVNHHQHCFSGSELYNKGYIFYGLGNFFFDDQTMTGDWNEGFFVELNINHHHVESFQIFPYIQCDSKGPNVRLMDETEQSIFMNKLEGLNSIISCVETLNKEFDSYCRKMASGYMIDFAPYTNKYLKALCKRHLIPSFFTKSRRLIALNDIQCEAHRDILLKALSDN